jgi:hypothetical protein
MKYLCCLFIVLPLLFFAQVKEIEQDSSDYEFIKIKGDSMLRKVINLDEVMLLNRLKFNSKEDRKRYLIIRRKTIKVYPYAKLASERLDSLRSRLAKLKRKRNKKRYAKKIQKYIEGEFTDELKKLTHTEGQILIKLIHRQTGRTSFDLIKELRNGWSAFWFNNTARIFNISLKKEFDPYNEKEDYLIEDVLQRNFQSGRLVRQKSALDIDFYELTAKWLKSNSDAPNNENSN